MNKRSEIMDKQEIAHILKNEIATTERTINKLQLLQSQIVDSHQARDIGDTIQELVTHKQKLETIIEQINEDARSYNRPYSFGL